MSLMLTAAAARSSASAPLLLRPSTLRLTPPSGLKLTSSTTVPSPHLAASFASSARRVRVTSKSAARVESAGSVTSAASAPPAAELPVRADSSATANSICSVGQSRMQSAMDKLAPIARSETDPLVSAVLDSWAAIEALRKRHPSRDEIVKELDQVLLRLSDVALWMPIPHGARVEWIANPSSLPFQPSPSTAESTSSRILSAFKRLQSVDSSYCHPPAAGLLDCMLNVRTVSRELRALQDPAPSSARTFLSVEYVQLSLETLALSQDAKRGVRWIAPTAEADKSKLAQNLGEASVWAWLFFWL